MKQRSSGQTSSPPERQRRVSINEGSAQEQLHSNAPGSPVQHQQQLLYTSPPNGYHHYSPTKTSPIHSNGGGNYNEQDQEDEQQHPLDRSPPRSLRARTINRNGRKSLIGGKKKKTKSTSKRRSICYAWRRWYNKWIKEAVSSFGPLFVALMLWYLLGVVSIATSKLLLMEVSPEVTSTLSDPSRESNSQPKHLHHHPHHRHRHHHPLIGGVPALYLTLQQFVIGACLLRFLLSIRCMGSAGLVPWPLSSDLHQPGSDRYQRPHARASVFVTKWLRSMPTFNVHLVGSGVFFCLGFLTTNFGFSGSSASFVETIKAAEPISSAMVAVWYGIEVLSRNEMTSLATIVFGVVLSTVGNSHGTDSPEEPIGGNHSSRTAFMQSLQSCVIVMLANLSFSFRGLCQKLFRGTPEGSNQRVDDLNLQFRMQQIGIGLLVVPVFIFDTWGMLRYIWHIHAKYGLWSSGVTSRYIGLSLLNGCAFASYNLASTYILSRISVVHHAALNCVRRVWAIVVTSIYFVVPVTFVGGLGILVSFGGFMSFTHYKVKRQLQPKPLSSLLPVSKSTPDRALTERTWTDAQIRYSTYDVATHDEDDDNCDGGLGAVSTGQADVDDSRTTFSVEFQLSESRAIHIQLSGYENDSDETYVSTGITLWRSAHHLCDYMIENANSLQGKRILELGAGLGLNGILAYHLTRDEEPSENSFVVLTDGDTNALSHLRENIEANTKEIVDDTKQAPSESILAEQLLWSKDSACDFLERHDNDTFDVILGSDLVYVDGIVDPLFETVQVLLSDYGEFYFSYCSRRQAPVELDFVLNRAQKAGFKYECLDDKDDIQVFVFRGDHES